MLYVCSLRNQFIPSAIMKQFIFVFIAAVMLVTTGKAQTNKMQDNGRPMELIAFDTIKLLEPDTLSGIPLMQAISRRKSDRKFESKNLTLKNLSEILWVANGINRANGKRTVPSAMAQYPLQTYVVLVNGIYFYNPQKHQLEPVVKGDYRNLAGKQTFVNTAPLNILYIAKARNENDDFRMAMMDSGYCGQNVYLYCASVGLKCVVRAGAQEEKLLQTMKLSSGFKFILAQTVGY